MWKIRCKMISVQNEEKARKLVNFLIEEDDRTIRKATEREFVLCVQDLNGYSNGSSVS